MPRLLARRPLAVHRLLSAWRIRRRRHALLGAKSATVLAAVIAHGGAALLFTLATPRPGLGLGGVLLAGGVSALLAVGAAACLPTARRGTPAAGRPEPQLTLMRLFYRFCWGFTMGDVVRSPPVQPLGALPRGIMGSSSRKVCERPPMGEPPSTTYLRIPRRAHPASLTDHGTVVTR
jgi:hypothetical protein